MIHVNEQGVSIPIPALLTCSLGDGIWQTATTWADALFFNELASKTSTFTCWRRTAVDEVMIKAPPSGLALNVGKAALKR
jgi:hypothetical protein